MRLPFFYFNLFLKRFGIAALIFTLCRLLFLSYNHDFFSNYSIVEFIYGIRFDLSAIAWIYLPFLFFQILPFPFRKNRWYRVFLKVLFHMSNTVCLILNLLDLEFFEFTLRRSTTDIFAMFNGGEEFFTLLPSFLKDYWFTLLLLPLLVWLSNMLYNRTEPKEYPSKNQFLLQFTLSVIAFGLIVITSRGGVQLRPIGFITASQMTEPQNVPLVLNTPFTFMKSLNKRALEMKHYFPENELDHVFTPEKIHPHPKGEFERKNVVVIIMESFSKEYIGWYNSGEGYTPFLDSLMNHSMVFTKAYANGKRSIESLPAIFSGIPNLMNEPFITSPYAGNEISSVTKILNNYGYHSSFYHGGNNGTMGFDAYAEISGFNDYKGRAEYNNDKDYDGNWGIFDLPFFQYFKSELDKEEGPFIAGIFSLSSHHPYSIPSDLSGNFNKGELPIHETIGYSDFALKKFFKKAALSEWYNNTVFVITADHTAQSNDAFYRNIVGSYAIPLIVFKPWEDELHKIDNTTQQCDIQSIILNELNYSQPYFSFGDLPLDSLNPSYNITLNNGIYQFIYQNHVLHFDGEKSNGFFDLRVDSMLQHNLLEQKPQLMIKMERSLKGLIQSFNQRMITNSMHLESE